jgi:hypothetical protein
MDDLVSAKPEHVALRRTGIAGTNSRYSARSAILEELASEIKRLGVGKHVLPFTFKNGAGHAHIAQADLLSSKHIRDNRSWKEYQWPEKAPSLDEGFPSFIYFASGRLDAPCFSLCRSPSVSHKQEVLRL